MLSKKNLTPDVLVELHGFEYDKVYSAKSSKITQLQATHDANIFEHLCTENVFVPYGNEFLLNPNYSEKKPYYVSFYKDLFLSPEYGLQIGKKTNILDIFKDVKNGKYKELCLQIRDLAHKERAETATPEEIKKYQSARTKLKHKLPCFTTSGIFPNNQRAGQNIVVGTYTQVMQVDIDFKDNKFIDMQELRNDLTTLPYVVSVFTSPSGDIKCFVRHDAPVEKHLQAFLYIEKLFNDNFDVKIDQQCKDVSRVCFVSYDENIYINENCTKLKIDYITVASIEKTPNYEKRFNAIPNKSNSKGNKFDNVFDFCVFAVEQKHVFIDGNKSDYRFNLACLMNEYGISLNDAHDFINKNYPDARNKLSNDVKSAYKKTDKHGSIPFKPYKKTVPTQKNSTKGTNATKGTNKETTAEQPTNSKLDILLAKIFEEQKTKGIAFESTVKNIVEFEKIDFKIVREIGERFLKGDFAEELTINNKDIPQYTRIKAFLNKNYDFKFNEVSNTLFFRDKGKKDFKVCNEANLEDKLFESGFKDFKDKISTMLACDFIPKYNPFLDYFENLPKWNGKTDYIELLANNVVAKNQEWFNSQFKKMLVRMVAQSLNKINFNKHCFVLASPKQNIGKSSFMKFLCPKKLKEYYTEDIDFENKDGAIALCENFIVNLDELAQIPKKNLDKIKSVMTQTTTKVRRPFAKKAESINRVANFVGTTNKTEFLTDTTGNVRWLIFEVDYVKYDSNNDKFFFENIDIDLVYSQAYALLKSGFNCKLANDELVFSEKNNQTHKSYSFEKELIEKHFAPSSKAEKKSVFYTTTDIVCFLCLKYPNLTNKININYVGGAMQSLGFIVEAKFFKEINNNKKGYYCNALT